MRDLINHFEHKNATKTTINFKCESKHIILVFFFLHVLHSFTQNSYEGGGKIH